MEVFGLKSSFCHNYVLKYHCETLGTTFKVTQHCMKWTLSCLIIKWQVCHAQSLNHMHECYGKAPVPGSTRIPCCYQQYVSASHEHGRHRQTVKQTAITILLQSKKCSGNAETFHDYSQVYMAFSKEQKQPNFTCTHNNSVKVVLK